MCRDLSHNTDILLFNDRYRLHLATNKLKITLLMLSKLANNRMLQLGLCTSPGLQCQSWFYIFIFSSSWRNEIGTVHDWYLKAKNCIQFWLLPFHFLSNNYAGKCFYFTNQSVCMKYISVINYSSFTSLIYIICYNDVNNC